MGSSSSSCTVSCSAHSCIPKGCFSMRGKNVADFHDKYLLGAKLGRGMYAEVYVAAEIEDVTNKQAAKVSSLRSRDGSKATRLKVKTALQLEEALWLSVGKHENCVALHEVFYGRALCYMVMERCRLDLYHYLKRMPELTERTIGQVFVQMLCGLSHVHELRLVHCDVKPNNWLVGGNDGRTVKLCDFGLSHRLPEGGRLFDVVGTAPFMCPEMLCGAGYDCKADVWSLGVLVYALLFGAFPYMPEEMNSKLMKAAIVDGTIPTFAPVGPSIEKGEDIRSRKAVEFATSLLCRDASQRPSAMEALHMECLTTMGERINAESVDLPSLLPMLYSAIEVGAFDTQDIHLESEIDTLLNTLQIEAHNKPLPKRVMSRCTTICAGVPKTTSSEVTSPRLSTLSTACPSDWSSRN